MLQHVLFDNDGTIVDSEIIAVRSMLELLMPFGIAMDEKTYCQRYPGLQTRQILEMLEEEFSISLPDNFLEQIRAHHTDLFDQSLLPIEGMAELFREVNLPKSMVSNGSVRHVERCLTLVGLLDALDGEIFSAEHVVRPKPHPDLYLYAAESLKLPPEALVVIEDSPTGVTAAASAGLAVIGFLGAGHVHPGHDEALIAGGAEELAQNAAELRVILQRRGAI